MIRVSLATKGLDGARARLAALPGRAAEQVGATLGDAAEAAADDLRLTLQQDTGSASPGRSLSGAPPADAKGRIAAAVTAARNSNGTGATVTVDLPFARDLEFGTRRMAPRPFLRPLMLQAHGKTVAALGAAMRGLLSAAKGTPR